MALRLACAEPNYIIYIHIALNKQPGKLRPKPQLWLRRNRMKLIRNIEEAPIGVTFCMCGPNYIIYIHNGINSDGDVGVSSATLRKLPLALRIACAEPNMQYCGSSHWHCVLHVRTQLIRNIAEALIVVRNGMNSVEDVGASSMFVNLLRIACADLMIYAILRKLPLALRIYT